MATRFLTRSLLSSPRPALDSFFTRSFSALAVKISPAQPSALSLFRLRPLVAVASTFRSGSLSSGSARAFSTRSTNSSLSDPNPNWTNRPPKETILLDGCDFEHWLVVVEQPQGDLTRDDIIKGYISTLAQVVGSEDEARMKIYSVSTKHYFAFGALVSEELSYKLKELPGVRWVLPDSYLDVRNKDYGGEPFINGEAVPYDPKYHEEWVRNNSRASERNRRNSRPRDNDRSRNFERRRPPQGPPQNNGGYAPPPNNMGGGMAPPNNMGGGMAPPNNMGGGMAPPNNMGGGMAPPNNMGGGMAPPNNMGGGGGGMPPNAQYNPAPGPNANYRPHQNQSMGNSAPYPPQQGNAAPYPPQAGNNAPYPPQHANAAAPQQQNGYQPNYMQNNAPNPQQYGNAPPYGGQGHYQSGPGPNAQNMYQNQNQNFPGRD